MPGAEESIRARLTAQRDEGYAAFAAKLIPTVDPATMIGVRTPVMKKLVKEVRGAPEAEEFLTILPHKYYEENGLHAVLIGDIPAYERAVEAVDAFLPYVDNWAICDSLSPKAFYKHRPELYAYIPVWLASGHTYTVRFGIEMLMSHFLDEAFTPDALERVAAVRSEEYYVNMMIAWFFATALAKQYDAALPYIEQKRLDRWTHNKTIQKAAESYRITDEQKAYLRSLKIPARG